MQGMGATGATRGARGTGRSEGSVGVSSAGIELGLKVGGIGQLGISTGYGGGIVIGIFGQKIVWGREGGKIHYNFGGLEVIVEAGNCVVVETRKIFGQVTGRHVYPDPGCKLPPEDPTDTPTPPDIPEESDGTQKLQGMEEAIVLISGLHSRYQYEAFQGVQTLHETTSKTFPSVVNVEIALSNPFLVTNYSFTSDVKISGIGRTIGAYFHNFKNYYSAGKNISLSMSAFPAIRRAVVAETSTTVRIEDEWSPEIAKGYSAESDIHYILVGSQAVIKDFIKYRNALPENTVNNNSSFGTYVSIIRITKRLKVERVIPFKSIHIPVPSAGNQPPMLESCCESLSADIADLMEVLAVKEIQAGKLTVPWAGRMPGGQGEEIIFDYPNLLRTLWQFIDHLGIHPPKLTIKDINNAIAGDQSLTNQFPSVTQAFEALMAQVWDANADVDTLTNFLYRLAWLSVQQSFNLASLTGSVESLKDMVGGETEALETTLTTPFNIEAGTAPRKAPPSGKGFGKPSNNGKDAKGAIDNRIETKTEMATEAMLPEFLKIRENPILVDSFTGKQDLFDILLLIRADLEKIKNSR